MHTTRSRRLRAALFLTAFTIALFAPSAFAERNWEEPSDPCVPRWTNAWCAFQ